MPPPAIASSEPTLAQPTSFPRQAYAPSPSHPSRQPRHSSPARFAKSARAASESWLAARDEGRWAAIDERCFVLAVYDKILELLYLDGDDGSTSTREDLEDTCLLVYGEAIMALSMSTCDVVTIPPYSTVYEFARTAVGLSISESDDEASAANSDRTGGPTPPVSRRSTPSVDSPSKRHSPRKSVPVRSSSQRSSPRAERSESELLRTPELAHEPEVKEASVRLKDSFSEGEDTLVNEDPSSSVIVKSVVIDTDGSVAATRVEPITPPKTSYWTETRETVTTPTLTNSTASGDYASAEDEWTDEEDRSTTDGRDDEGTTFDTCSYDSYSTTEEDYRADRTLDSMGTLDSFGTLDSDASVAAYNPATTVAYEEVVLYMAHWSALHAASVAQHRMQRLGIVDEVWISEDAD